MGCSNVCAKFGWGMTCDKWNYFRRLMRKHPDSKVHRANMGPTWVLAAPDWSHVGPMNLAIRASQTLSSEYSTMFHTDTNKRYYEMTNIMKNERKLSYTKNQKRSVLTVRFIPSIHCAWTETLCHWIANKCSILSKHAGFCCPLVRFG